MNYLQNFILILFCGCAAQKPVQLTPDISAIMPPMPVVAKSAITLPDKKCLTVQPLPNFPRFIFPADAANYNWSLERSTDLAHWQRVADFGAFAPNETPEPYAVALTGDCGYFRMKGTR